MTLRLSVLSTTYIAINSAGKSVLFCNSIVIFDTNIIKIITDEQEYKLRIGTLIRSSSYPKAIYDTP